MKLCRDCRFYKGGMCRRKYKKVVSLITGEVEHSGLSAYAESERAYSFIPAILTGKCGKMGLYWKGKVEDEAPNRD